MAIGTLQASTADLSLTLRRALADACALVTHLCLDDLGDPNHAWLSSVIPAGLEADPQDDLTARRFLATVVAVGQKLIDPRPHQPSSPAELLAFSLICREASLEPRLLSHIRCYDATLATLGHLAESLPEFAAWFEPDDELNPSHPYVMLTEDDAREVHVLIDLDEALEL